RRGCRQFRSRARRRGTDRTYDFWYRGALVSPQVTAVVVSPCLYGSCAGPSLLRPPGARNWLPALEVFEGREPFVFSRKEQCVQATAKRSAPDLDEDPPIFR